LSDAMISDVRAGTVPALGACVIGLAAGCGGGGVSAADRSEGDHRIGLIPAATADVEKVERIGKWTGSDNVLVAWLKVTLKEGAPYVVCISVDVAGPIADENDLSLVVTTQPESACEGTKPTP
jgi:hypothetical protein